MSPKNEIKGIGLGIILLGSLHYLAWNLGGIIIFISVSIGGIAAYLATFLVLCALVIGIAQLIYVIPTILILRRRRNLAVVKGVIIGAVITALLNGGCWLFLYSVGR